MSDRERQSIEACVRANLEDYFRDLDGTDPAGLYDMLGRWWKNPCWTW